MTETDSIWNGVSLSTDTVDHSASRCQNSSLASQQLTLAGLCRDLCTNTRSVITTSSAHCSHSDTTYFPREDDTAFTRLKNPLVHRGQASILRKLKETNYQKETSSLSITVQRCTHFKESIRLVFMGQKSTKSPIRLQIKTYVHIYSNNTATLRHYAW
jgi:hypothetical protein